MFIQMPYMISHTQSIQELLNCALHDGCLRRIEKQNFLKLSFMVRAGL